MPARLPGRAVRDQDLQVPGGRAPLLGAAAGRRRGHLRVLRLPRRALQHAAQGNPYIDYILPEPETYYCFEGVINLYNLFL